MSARALTWPQPSPRSGESPRSTLSARHVHPCSCHPSSPAHAQGYACPTLLQNGYIPRAAPTTMVPKSFSRASLCCPVRLRNNTMPAALEEGGVLPWRELSMTWGSSRRQDHGQQQRPEGWLASSPASSIVEDIDFCGRGRCFQKNARRNAARSEGVWPRRPLQRPKRN